MKNKKAQVFTWDLVVSLVIFLVIFALLIYLWDTILWNIGSSEKRDEMDWLAKTVSDQLVRTTGIPKNWSLQPENVTVIGLVYEDKFGYSQDRVLSIDKLLYFINLTTQNYTPLRNKLLATGEYDFYIEVSCLNQSENCWNNMLVSIIDNATINCSNDANFTIINKTLSYHGEQVCIIGNYTEPSASNDTMITHETKTATFKNNLNSTIKITLAVWTGISAPIPLIPVLTTTTTLPIGTLNCGVYPVDSCPGGFNSFTPIFSVYQEDNSHAGIYGVYNTPNAACCKVEGGTLTVTNTTSNCLPGHGCVLSLFRAENSHAGACGSYTNKVCMNTSLGNISCSLQTGTSCPDGIYAVASLYDTTNAHVGGKTTYVNKICCNITVS